MFNNVKPVGFVKKDTVSQASFEGWCITALDEVRAFIESEKGAPSFILEMPVDISGSHDIESLHTALYNVLRKIEGLGVSSEDTLGCNWGQFEFVLDGEACMNTQFFLVFTMYSV